MENNDNLKLARLLCKSMQRMCVDRGLIEPTDLIQDSLVDSFSIEELKYARRIFHELLYAPVAKL